MGADFNSEIMEEVWDEVQASSQGVVTVSAFAKVLAQAIGILQDRINLVSGQNGIPHFERELEVLRKEQSRAEYRY